MCGKGTWRFLKSVMLAAPEDSLARARLIDAVAVAMEQWSTQHRAFVVKIFLKIVTVFKTQRIFRKHFNISRHGKVPCRNTIQLWVENFRTSASASKKQHSGSVSTMRSPQNVEAVRHSFIRGSRCSARRYSVALEISNRSVRRILHKDLNFHPYKMAVVRT
jgi:hypothetical protein